MHEQPRSNFLNFFNKIPTSVIAGGVFLAGIVNMVSVAIPPVPARLRFVIDHFHIQYVQDARWASLFIGVGLVLTSIYIYRRKYRAWQIAFGLTLVSVFLHVTKGLDYEEALTLIVVFIVLWLTRRKFSIKSGAPTLRYVLIAAVLSLFAIYLYGVIGFLYLNATFRIDDVSLITAIKGTLKTMTFHPPAILHMTRRISNFIYSLEVLTVSALVFNLTSLYRPVRWLLSADEAKLERVRQIINEHSEVPYDYFKIWPHKSLYFSPSDNSAVAYGVSSGMALALGDPVGPQTDLSEIVKSFKTFSHNRGWIAAFYQTTDRSAKSFSESNFKSMRIGDDAIVELNKFASPDLFSKDFRYAYKRFQKFGYTSKFLNKPLADADLEELRETSESWLGIAGHRERQFTLGQFDENYLNSTDIFAVFDENGHIAAFANLLHAEKSKMSTIDLMRYRKQAPSGIMDFLFLSLFLELAKQGQEKFSMGLAPFSHVKDSENLNYKIMDKFLGQLNFLFNFQGIRKYKAKYATLWEPRYLVFESYDDLPNIILALRRLTEIK